MNIKNLTVDLLLLTVTLMSFYSIAAKTFGNEKEIQFKSGEQSVMAYEGSIQVLENRNDKNSRTIPLTYVRFPATGNKKRSFIWRTWRLGYFYRAVPKFSIPIIYGVKRVW